MKIINKVIFTVLFSIFCFSNSVAQERKKEESVKEKSIKSNIEAGATISQGNTEEESIYSKTKIDYQKERYSNILKTRMENTKVNDLRVKERYDINNQTRYNFSKKNYRFLEIEYIDDRFGGYDYRSSETVGLGRDLVKRENIVLSGQLSAGLRQSKFTDSEKENTFLVRAGFDFNWKIKEGVEFNEHLDISRDQDATITKSDASLKISLDKIHHSIYLQIGYFFENRSAVPDPSFNKTDTTFMTTIGYSY